MKKSLLALVLAMCMCLTVLLSGCSSSDDDGENSNVINTDSEISAMTVTLYAPTKSTTTQDQVELVQAAFNEITRSKYNTNVILKLIPEDKYEETINSTLEAIHKKIEEEEAAEAARFEAEREAMLRGETLPPEETEVPETEEADDSKNSPALSYPDEKENQLDIFLVRSFETYYELAMNNELSPLDKDISEGSKLLNSYVYPYLLRGAKVDGSVYGVFNNTVFGEYQYLLLNKELVDKYCYDPEKMSNISSISLFLREVKQKEPDVIPFLGNLEAPVIYLGGQESLMGTYLGTSLVSSGTIDATSFVPDFMLEGTLLSNPAYKQWITSYNELNQAGCFVEKTEANQNSKFAATVISGDATLSPTYEEEYGRYKTDKFGFKYITENGVDYYVSVIKRPVADNSNVFGAGYVVSSYAEDVSRCMQIITCLNTDEAISNLFMYGIQDVHYTLDEATNVVHRISDKYMMDITTIGNIYLLKQSDDMSDYWKNMSNNNWQNAKNTNREAIFSPYIGYVPGFDTPEASEFPAGQAVVSYDEALAEVQKLSEGYLNSLKNYVNTADKDFAAYYNEIKKEVESTTIFKLLADPETGVYYVFDNYVDWYQRQFGVKVNLEA